MSPVSGVRGQARPKLVQGIRGFVPDQGSGRLVKLNVMDAASMFRVLLHLHLPSWALSPEKSSRRVP